MKKQFFHCPREAFLDCIVEFAAQHLDEEIQKKISLKSANDFIDGFLKKYFMDYEDDE